MINDLGPYPAMRDSGVPWLGEVPKHWKLGRLRSSVHNVIVQSGERQNGELYVALEHVESWTGRIRPAGPDVALDSQVKRFESGDVLFGKLRPYLAKVARPERSGVCVGEFFVLRPRDREVTPSYLAHLLRSKPIVDAVNSSTFGAKMPRTGWDFLGGMKVPTPPRDEQDAIVIFCDHVDGRIRRYIRTKQKLIKLLEEYKQAIIEQAVTRGLDPDVRLTTSGVQWLGRVPAHWDVLKLARIISDGPRNGISPPIVETEGVESFSISAIRNGSVDVRSQDVKYVLGGEDALTANFSLRSGDVLLVRGNGNLRLVGRAGLVSNDMPGRIYPDLLMRLRVTKRCLPSFLVAALTSNTGRVQIESAARTAVGTYKINNQQVRQFCFAFPPEDEQERIMAWLEARTGPLDRAVIRAEATIAHANELRSRLLFDVVSGKVDVRDTVARLVTEPDEVELDDIPACEEGVEDLVEEDSDVGV